MTSREYNRQYYITHKSEQIQYHRDRRERIKLSIIKEAGGKCSVCGYSKCLSALDFHHTNPAEKTERQNKSLCNMKLAHKEAKKCILLCANCHRELHFPKELTNV